MITRTNWGTAGQPVAAVEVEDLRTAWRISAELRQKLLDDGKIDSDTHLGMDWMCFKDQFKSDLPAVSFRWMLLGLASYFQSPENVKNGWKAEPSEAVFKATATFPMTWPTHDSEKLPFDVGSFLDLCGTAPPPKQ